MVGVPSNVEVPLQLGRFEVREWVGEGSFAEVYLGHDLRLDRAVALKVARPGTLGTPRRVKRFLREARSAGNLRHPNIVPLYETGEDAGRHFLVYAFIRGRTLGSAIDEARPTGGLDAREAVRITRRLAGALAYAHGEGVVHRDLKPDNVMMDEKGEPLLMDFGLASRADPEEGDERLTQQGVAVGTPAYMAPEQARGDVGNIGPAADQYALGCTLYELLTGRTPFTGPPQVQLLLHQTEEVGRPSRHNKSIPRDLDAICLKCLAKDPNERYASAEDLAEDLDRFLRGEPVLARRQTVRYLAGKFVRRYRRSLAVATAVLLLALGGTAAAFVRINAERADAVAASDREQDERKKAEQALIDLEQSRKESQVVQEVIDQAYTNIQDENIRHIKGLGATHEELAAIRLKGYERLAEVAPNDPTVAPRLARGHFVLGVIRSLVGRLDQATDNLRRSAELYEQLEKDHPDDPAYRTLRVRALNELGYVYYVAEFNAKAQPILERSLALADEGLKTRPDDFGLQYEAAFAAIRVVQFLTSKADKPRILALYDRSIETNERLLRAGYRPADNRLNLAIAKAHRFDDTAEVSDPKAKWKVLQDYKSELEEVRRLLPDSPFVGYFTAFVRVDLATKAQWQQSPANARPLFDEAVALVRVLAKDNPAVARLVGYLPGVLVDSADNFQRVGRLADARRAYEEAIQLQSAVAERFDDRPSHARFLLRLRAGYAEFLSTSNANSDPVSKAQEVLRVRDQVVADGRRASERFPDNPMLNADFAAALWKRVLIDTEAGQGKKVEGYARELVLVCKQRVIPHEPPQTRPDDMLKWFDAAKVAFVAADKPDDVLALEQVATDLAPHATPDGLQAACSILNNCAITHIKAKRFREAIPICEKVIRLAGPAVEKEFWDWYLRDSFLGGHKGLAEIYKELGDPAKEVRSLREYLRLWYEPYTPVDCKRFLEPGRPEDAAEAKAIRDAMATSTGMKRFTIPCDFNGVKYPIHIYVTDTKWPRHPIEDQARWVKERRGGTIPKEVMDSFWRLRVIAHENNVSFQDLCVYALGAAAAEEGTTLKVENVGVDAPKTVKADDTKLNALIARGAELRTLFEEGKKDRQTCSELAATYQSIAELQTAAGRPAEAVSALEGGIRAAEEAAVSPAVQKADLELLARLVRDLARAYTKADRLDDAVRTQVRFLEIADLLRKSSFSGVGSTDWFAQRTAGWVALGDILVLRKQWGEAAAWYLKAVDARSDEAARKFAGVVKESPTVLALAPDDVRMAYRTAQGKGDFKGDLKAELKGVPDRFVTAIKTLRDINTRQSLAAAEKERAAKAVGLGRRADQFRKLADDYRERGNLADAAAWLLEEFTTRDEQARSVPNDEAAKAACAEAAYRLALLSSELKRSADAAKWMREAVLRWHEPARFVWADWHAEGTHVDRDEKVAIRLRATAHSVRGNRLVREKKYAEALSDFQKVTQFAPESASAFDLLGQMNGKLGRWDEALVAYRKSFELESDLGTALNLIEALIVSGKAAEVPAFVAKLDPAITDPKLPLTPAVRYRLLFLNGLHAIALRLVNDDPKDSPPEEKMFGMTAVQAVSSGWSWDELDGWFASAKLPDNKRVAVKRIMDELKGIPQARSTPFYPLGVGAKWVYAADYTDNPDLKTPDITVEVKEPAKADDLAYFRLTEDIGYGTQTSKLVAVRHDGVYRRSDFTKDVQIERLFALPPASGTTWTDGKYTYGLLKATEVTVPAGTYKNVWIVEKTEGGKTVERSWFAENVGVVKVETPIAGKGGKKVLSLKSYTQPK